MSWREDLVHFVAKARESETRVRAARVRGLAPCQSPSEPPGPGPVESNGHTFSWGVCLSCAGLDPDNQEREPAYSLGLADARAILKATTRLDPGPHVRAAAIMKAAATFFDVPLSSLAKPWRQREYTEPRHVAMYLAYTDTELSYPEVGKLFERDHSTVMYAVQRITSSLKDDVKTTEQVDAVRALARAVEAAT